MKRECKRCGSYIPYIILVNGKRGSLQNRKFCLKCNPYKNGKGRIDMSRPPKGHNKPYSEWEEDEKIKHREAIVRRGIQNKQKLVEMSGGKCIKCGYNKSLNNLWSKSWNTIEKEWQKCELLCANCHSELLSFRTGF